MYRALPVSKFLFKNSAHHGILSDGFLSSDISGYRASLPHPWSNSAVLRDPSTRAGANQDDGADCIELRIV